MIYSVKVVETRTIVCIYEVEADSEAEAMEKASDGETEAEYPRENTVEVLNRTVYGVEPD